MQVGGKSLPILSWQPNVVVPKPVSVEIPEQSHTDPAGTGQEEGRGNPRPPERAWGTG